MAHASRLGQKKRERERERLNNGDNNGQATHGARKSPGPKKEKEKKKRERAKVGDNNGQAMHGARMAHASRLGQFFLLQTHTDDRVTNGGGSTN